MGLVLRPALGIAGAYFLWRVLTGILLVNPAAATAERLGLACAALLPGVLMLNLMIAFQMLVRAWSRAIDSAAPLIRNPRSLIARVCASETS